MSKIKKTSDALIDIAKKVLENYNTEEKIMSLSGQDKKLYEKALDILFGPKEKRARDLGYNLEHSFVQTEQIKGKPKYLKSNGAKNLAKKYGTMENEIVVEGFSPDNQLIWGPNTEAYNLARKRTGTADRALGSTGKELLMEEAEIQKKVLHDPINEEYYIPKSANVRTVDAYFDPRFASSRNKMMGVASLPIADNLTTPDASPFQATTELFGKYENIKNKLNEYLSKELNLAKDEKTQEDLKTMLDIAIDPLGNSPLGIPIEFLKTLAASKK